MKKKMKRMDDGGPVKAMGRMKRGEDRDEMREGRMERRAERMKMREDRPMRTQMPNREAVMGRVREKLGAMGPQVGNALQKIGQGIGSMRGENPARAMTPLAKPAMAPAAPAMAPAAPQQKPMMRGGGLARKGAGQALAKGGLVKANGCATRGKTRGKMV